MEKLWSIDRLGHLHATSCKTPTEALPLDPTGGLHPNPVPTSVCNQRFLYLPLHTAGVHHVQKINNTFHRK